MPAKNCECVKDDGPIVSIAKLSEQMFPNSMATPRLFAHILTAKFADAPPYYGHEKQFSTIGIELLRSTMHNWAIKVARACEILVGSMQAQNQCPVINLNETTVQVLKKLNRSNRYMYMFKGGQRTNRSYCFSIVQ